MMNLIKDRSRAEVVLFATAAFGIWLSIWAVLLSSAVLDVAALFFTIVPLLVFALRGVD